jgi:hypothetical protein
MTGIKSGVTGCVLLSISLIMTLILAAILYFTPAFTITTAIAYVVIAIVTGVLLAISVILVSVGAMKLGGFYKNALSTVSGIIGLISGIMYLVSILLATATIFVLGVAGISVIMSIVSSILMGVFLLLLGTVFILIRSNLSSAGLAMATGILTIITGSFFCSVILQIIGVIMLIPTAIMMVYVFKRAKGVSEEKPKKEVEEEEETEAPKKVKKLVVRAVEEKPRLKPAEVEAAVYKYVKSHPGGVDTEDCAEKLGISEKEVEKTVNTLVKKGKLEIG